MSSRSECPPPSTIDAIAAGGECASEVMRHIESCEACSGRLREAVSDETFLGRFRDLVVPNLGPAGSPRIPGYRVLEVLDSGSQGIVFKAIQESTSRPVAIKTVRTAEQTSEQRQRAAREVEIIARLDHPGIVTIYESRELSDGRIAVIMEFVDGVPLDAWRPSEAPGEAGASRRALLGVFELVCIAVHHAHLNGVIHRDLKPENILVDATGRPVVLDFGIARLGDTFATRTGEFAGTPAYASPEQASGEPGLVDALTDVYSLGVILYRVMCGAMPYELDGSILDMVRTIMSADPVRPRVRDSRIDADLEAVMLRALRKEKFGRYQSAEALGRDIRRYLDGHPVEARSGSGWYLLRKAVLVNRRRLTLTAGAALLLIASVVVVVVSVGDARAAARRETAQRERARQERIRALAVTELLRDTMPASDPSQPQVTSMIYAGFWRLHQRLETGVFADTPELDLEIRRLWGSVYTGLGSGRVTEFVEYAEMSLRNGLIRLRERHGSADHPEVASTLHELAAVLVVRGRFAEAESTALKACAMRARLYGDDSPELGASVALHARVLSGRALPHEAMVRADEAIALLGGLPESERELPVSAMVALKAREALTIGDAASAEPWIRDALEVRIKRLSPADSDLFESLAQIADLAELAPRSKLVEEARVAWRSESPAALARDLRRDIETLKTIDPSESGRVFVTGRTMALDRLLRLYELFLGPEHPALAGVLMTQVRAAQYEFILDIRANATVRAAAILKRRFGENDVSVLTCYEMAASAEAYANQTAHAVELQEVADRIWRHLPDDARDALLAANCRRTLAWYLDLAGRHAEAVPMYRSALDEFSELLDPEHYIIALAHSGLAMSMASLGDIAGADELSARALAVTTGVPGIPIDTAGHIEFSRGHILMLQGRYAEARPALERAWEVSYWSSGETFPWRVQALEDLARVCDELKDPAASREWRDRAKPGLQDARRGISRTQSVPE